MTSQEIFDTSVTALLKQGRRSVKPSGYCMFRGPNGTKCAVGHLIPDDDYDPRMDQTLGEDGLGNSYTLELVAQKLETGQSFLFGLQRCHDKSSDTNFDSDFRHLARAFAEDHELNTSVLDTQNG